MAERKIFIDIYHTPQYNFFRNAIKELGPDRVDLCCVDRGKMANIIRHELPEFNLRVIGDYKHNKGMKSMVLKIILPRMWKLWWMIKKRKYRFVVTAHYQANFVAWLKGIPNVGFNDDPRKFVFASLMKSANEVYLPPFAEPIEGTHTFNALKEWAYLSPKYFKPNPKVLEKYGLEPKGYVFAREVSILTSNYFDQEKDIILSKSGEIPSDIPVLLSLENKFVKDKYPSNFIVLEEPVEDIHSLMFYSRALMSSGDSMAREGAMLGVPSLYLGFRDMPANEIMIKRKMLEKVDPRDLSKTITKYWQHPMTEDHQTTFRNDLMTEWDDVTELILNRIEELALK